MESLLAGYSKLGPLHMSVASDFEGVRSRERKVVAAKATQPRRVWGHARHTKFQNLGYGKCHFQRFPRDIFCKLIRMKMQ